MTVHARTCGPDGDADLAHIVVVANDAAAGVQRVAHPGRNEQNTVPRHDLRNVAPQTLLHTYIFNNDDGKISINKNSIIKLEKQVLGYA
jgi:hypothetical protein